MWSSTSIEIRFAIMQADIGNRIIIDNKLVLLALGHQALIPILAENSLRRWTWPRRSH